MTGGVSMAIENCPLAATRYVMLTISESSFQEHPFKSISCPHEP